MSLVSNKLQLPQHNITRALNSSEDVFSNNLCVLEPLHNLAVLSHFSDLYHNHYMLGMGLTKSV